MLKACKLLPAPHSPESRKVSLLYDKTRSEKYQAIKF
jgi:hypothetical protein